ncbi:MAG: MFS transporter [Rhabdochlamydiaceae bacterium]
MVRVHQVSFFHLLVIMETKSFLPYSPKECFKTRFALLWMNLSSEPLVAIYTLIPFILRKTSELSVYQLALYTALNPVLAVFSFYWGHRLCRSKENLVKNLMTAWIFSRLPFVIIPFLNNFWAILTCSAFYHLFNRASTPALMEILKRNLPSQTRNQIFSRYYFYSVLEGIIIGFFILDVLKINLNNWKIIFSLCSLMSLTSLIWQKRIEIEPSSYTLSKQDKTPLKNCWQLLKKNHHFAKFQWGFMFGGLGLMISAPARYIFSADIPTVGLEDMTLARCLFVGLGLAISSFLWQKALDSYSIHKLTAWVLVGFGIYPICFAFTSWHIYFFYLAHIIYGVAQAGSHLIWHLSGPIFAGENQNSALFTTTNVLMVGLRGLVGPFLGGLLCHNMGPEIVLYIGGAVCLLGSWYMWRKDV